VPRALQSVGDTVDYATVRAERAHQRILQRYRLGCHSGPTGCIRVDPVAPIQERIRNDETLTAARYDEIVELRMLLMDIDEMLDESGMFPDVLSRIRKPIQDRVKKWGKKGDCV
jgi:hypothetical protein